MSIIVLESIVSLRQRSAGDSNNPPYPVLPSLIERVSNKIHSQGSSVLGFAMYSLIMRANKELLSKFVKHDNKFRYPLLSRTDLNCRAKILIPSVLTRLCSINEYTHCVLFSRRS